MRQERGQIRPQTVPPSPISSTMKIMQQNGKNSPSDMNNPQQRQIKNRHMTPTQYQNERRDNSRSQSPFKTRFVNQLPRDASPSARGNRKDE